MTQVCAKVFTEFVVLMLTASHAHGRALLQDSEQFSVDGIPEYQIWVRAGCGTKAFNQDCVRWQNMVTGGSKNPSTARVLFPNVAAQAVEFRSASIYTRVTALTCSLDKPACKVSKDSGGPLAGSSLDVACLAAFVDYSKQCHNVKGASPALCGRLSGEHCSCAGVKCSADTVTFDKIMTCTYADTMCNWIRPSSSTSG